MVLVLGLGLSAHQMGKSSACESMFFLFCASCFLRLKQIAVESADSC